MSIDWKLCLGLILAVCWAFAYCFIFDDSGARCTGAKKGPTIGGVIVIWGCQ